MTKYSILINTCDKFEDCWDPFFKLFKFYWPDCSGIIYLNTEYKDYSYPGLNVIPVKGCAKHQVSRSKRATWSQCLKWALEEIDTDIVLYMQEDYFLNAPVDDELFTKLMDMFTANSDMHCLHISNAMGGIDGPSQYEHLDLIKRVYRYRVGCQTAMWKRNVLMSYIKEGESAWGFEEFASERARFIPHNFYILNRDWLKKNPVLPYLATGIIQGRWWKPVVKLFEEHDIIIDYSKRGFVEETQSKPFIKRVNYRMRKMPKLLCHYIELSVLYFKYRGMPFDKISK